MEIYDNRLKEGLKEDGNNLFRSDRRHESGNELLRRPSILFSRCIALDWIIITLKGRA